MVDPDGGEPKGLFFLLAILLGIVGLVVWSPLPGGLWHDDGVYLLIGKALAQGDGLSYAGVPGTPPAGKFPPLYPGMLALLWAAFGTVERVVLAAQVGNVMLVLGALALHFHVLRKGLGLDALLAAGITLVVAMSVDLWQYALVPLSEPTFAFLITLFLAASLRVERSHDGGSWGAWAILTGVAACLMLTRSAGLAFVAAAALGAFSVGGARKGLAVSASCLALLSPWLVWSRRATEAVPGPLRDILGSYTPWWIDRVLSDPLAFIATLPTAATGLAERILRVLFPGIPLEIRWVIGLLVFPLLAWGLLILWRRSRIAATSLIFYFGLLWIWPFQDRRFLMPVIPLGFSLVALPLATVTGRIDSGEVGERVRPRGWGVRAAALLAASWMGYFTVVSGARLAGGWARAGLEVRAEALAAAVTATRDTQSLGQVVGAPELWAALHLYTGVEVVPSAPFRPGGVGARAFGSPAEQWAVWQAGGIQRLLVEHGGAVHGDALDLLEERCPGAIQILARLPGGYFVDLARTDPCVGSALATEEPPAD